jgi:hypothetical protein
MNEAINYWLFCIGLFIGCFFFQLIGIWQYRKILLMCADDETCEKLPDGQFYYIVPEWKYNALLRGGESYANMIEQERKEPK